MASKKLKLSKGYKLWKKAIKVIEGGTMLYSKNPDRFLPKYWPTYYSKAKGCEVWDLDNKKYIDFSIMSVGTNILGYANSEVNNYVIKTIKKGNISTLNSPLDIILAKELLKINPWAQKVKFAKTGGEILAIAIRISRSFTEKNNIAFCGYHGWHDWYLSANHNADDDLSEHLIPGLSPKGVPKNLKNSVFTFKYNNYQELVDLIEKYDIGVIKMEVIRNSAPEDDFLFKVRELANKKNIVLIFDECSSGFRETFGGIFQKFNVKPDMAMFGKTLGNGYAITAVVGKKSVMEAAQNSFISSTFWTERIGPTAALETLKVMERDKSWEKITNTGSKMQNGWLKLAKANKLDISIFGIPAMTTYTFNSKNTEAYKTFITQEMLKKGFLASTNFYACTKHNDEHLEIYLDALDDVYKIIYKCESEELDINKLLEGPICHSGFKRLN